MAFVKLFCYYKFNVMTFIFKYVFLLFGYMHTILKLEDWFSDGYFYQYHPFVIVREIWIEMFYAY